MSEIFEIKLRGHDPKPEKGVTITTFDSIHIGDEAKCPECGAPGEWSDEADEDCGGPYYVGICSGCRRLLELRPTRWQVMKA